MATIYSNLAQTLPVLEFEEIMFTTRNDMQRAHGAF